MENDVQRTLANGRKSLYAITQRLSRPVYFGLLLAFFVYGTWHCYSMFNMREQVSSKVMNTHCRDLHFGPHYCQPFTKHQFTKFLWFATDGWPVKYAKEVMEHYKDHGISYLIDIPGAKYSHAIYTSFFTGQLPTNYAGKPIEGDHLIRSMQRSNDETMQNDPWKFRYIGPEWSFLAIFGKENYDKMFTQIDLERESLDVHFGHPYPFFFENQEKIGYFNKYFYDMKSKGESMFAHTGVFDHRQHGEHKGLGPGAEDFPLTDRMARTMNTDFKSLKGLIDSNPEYLLILLSDHGVDEFGAEGYRMHGTTANGNEPFLLLYNPKLEPRSETRIDIVDVAPTLSFYLQGTEIPANSMGIFRSYFGENQTDMYIRALQRNIAQLSTAATERGVNVDMDKIEDYLRTVPNALNAEEKDKLYTEMLKYAEEIKLQMYNFLALPWFSVFAYLMVAGGLLMKMLLMYNEGIEYFIAIDSWALFVWELLSTIGLYGCCVVQLLYCWPGYGKVIDGGIIFRIFSPLLALVIIQYRRPSPTNISNQFANTRLQQMVSATTYTVEHLIHRNEIINLTVSFFTSCIPDSFGVVDEFPVVPHIVMLIAFYLTNRYFVTRIATDSKKIRTLKWERFGYLALIICIYLCNVTDKETWLSFFHFNIFALIVYLAGWIVLPCFYIYHRRIPDLILPINLILLMLFKDSAITKLMLMVLNYQYLNFVLPAVNLIQVRFADFSFLGRDLNNLHRAGVVLQASCLYAFNQIFFSFVFFFGDKINFDVHPFAGRIGMDAYDHYPLLSAWFMVFHKYGIFALFCIWAWQISHPNTDDLTRNESKEKEENRFFFLPPQATQKQTDYIVRSLQTAGSVLTDCITFHFAMTALGFYLLQIAVSKFHPIEQSMANTLLVGTVGAIHSTLCLLTAIWTQKKTKVTDDKQDEIHSK